MHLMFMECYCLIILKVSYAKFNCHQEFTMNFCSAILIIMD